MAQDVRTKSTISEYPWKNDSTRHSLHRLCSRICSFPPSLVRYFILKYSSPNDVVCDPFSGKGTLPLEALIQGRIGIGNDVSPEAFVLTKAKVSKIKIKDLFKFLNGLEVQMGFLKSTKGTGWKVRTFYSNYTLKQILEIRTLLQESKGKYANFVSALILDILHGSSKNSLSLSCSHSYSMSPNYVKKYAKEHQLKKPKRDVIECLRNNAMERLADGIPKKKGMAINCDSRKLKLNDDSVDLIVTSPPYFAVQTYAYDNWLRHWFLGYDYKEVNKSLVNTNSEKRYGEFMEDSFKEMFRILKKDKKCFVIIGDVKKKTKEGDIIINTANFLAKRARKVVLMLITFLLMKFLKRRKCSILLYVQQE